MPVEASQRLGPYEILSSIGAGGMGEVWRARDTRLNREVAIKFSQAQFTDRFQREANAIASLNHPNICTLFDVGSNYLVMELIEGPTLADRIKESPIPLDEALAIARQIADALEAAHEKGIVHRDLKPGNIKIRPDGSVKVLDFGLAKSVAGETAVTRDSPTVTQSPTQFGVILGTAAYMAPEQARGKTVDKRADIWSFGVVLYEMLTGKQPFEGEDLTEMLASVVKSDPDLKLIPRKVRRLLDACLQKDPKKRLRDIGDAWRLLEEAPREAVPAASSRRLWIGITAASLLAVAGWLAFFYLRPHQRPPQLQRFAIAAPEAGPTDIAVSPDGTQLVFSSSTSAGKLRLRRLDSLETRAIEGTDGAIGLPFWSPDSRFIAFSAGGKLRKIEVAGGPAQVLCDANVVVGGFWTPNGKIVFSDVLRFPNLFEVSSAGGTPSPLSGVGQHPSSEAIYSPVLLPDGRHFLYIQGTPQSGDVYLGSLNATPGQNGKKLVSGAAGIIAFAPSPDNPDLGYLLFPRSAGASGAVLAGTLMAQPFNLRKLGLAGEPVPVTEQISGFGFTASLSGALVYGGATESGRRLTVFDRQGKVAGTVGEMGNYGGTSRMAFSPDGGRIAAVRGQNIWIHDRSRGAGTRFTFGSGQDIAPIWSPDGSRIAFTSTRGGRTPMYQKLSNGGADEELLLDLEGGAVPWSWSGDGRFLLFSDLKGANSTLYLLPMDGNFHAAGKPRIFVKKGLGYEPRFSPGPQGRPLWVAYQSLESGRWEVYVRPFDPDSATGTPPDGGVAQTSTGGGISPRWNRNGRKLFYVVLDSTGGGTVMSVDVSKSPLQPGTPKPLFKPQGWTSPRSDVALWDASADGQQFVFAVAPAAQGASSPEPFTVVLNWPAMLKK